jgi:hypothetical protein
LVKELVDYDVDWAALCDGRFHNGPATCDYREANGNRGQNRLRISVNHFAFLRFVGGFNLDIPVIFRNQPLAIKCGQHQAAEGSSGIRAATPYPGFLAEPERWARNAVATASVPSGP